eukprot:g11361.t1
MMRKAPGSRVLALLSKPGQRGIATEKEDPFAQLQRQNDRMRKTCGGGPQVRRCLDPRPRNRELRSGKQKLTPPDRRCHDRHVEALDKFLTKVDGSPERFVEIVGIYRDKSGMKDEEDTLQGKAINRRGFFSLMYSRVLLFLFLGGRPRGALS